MILWDVDEKKKAYPSKDGVHLSFDGVI